MRCVIEWQRGLFQTDESRTRVTGPALVHERKGAYAEDETKQKQNL
jgi:hypothetical protein